MRPRIRSFKPEFWADEKVCSLSRDARLLMLGLISMADDEGRFRARRSQLIGDIFPDDDDAPTRLSEWVAEIQDQGIVLFYVTDGVPYGAFRNWRRHQKINKANSSLLPPPPSPKVVRDNSVPPTGGSREYSGSTTGDVTEASCLVRTRALRSDPFLVVDELENSVELSADRRIELLCELLAVRIVGNDEKARPAVFSERWLTEMRRLLADRNDDWQEVRRVIEWCQTDSFWRSNILSPSKLRAKFTALSIKANEPARSGVATISELDRKRLAGMQRAMNKGQAA